MSVHMSIMWTGESQCDLQFSAGVLRPVQNYARLFTHGRENTLPTVVPYSHHYRYDHKTSIIIIIIIIIIITLYIGRKN